MKRIYWVFDCPFIVDYISLNRGRLEAGMTSDNLGTDRKGTADYDRLELAWL